MNLKKERLEAKFAKAIDVFDAVIQELDYKEDWKQWDEEFIRKSKEPYFKEFPEIMAMFEKCVNYCKKEGYFDQ